MPVSHCSHPAKEDSLLRGISCLGHSLTIVGFEKQKHGTANLLVFDPVFRDPPALARLIGQTFKHKSADESLKPYRRGAKYLRRYREFEILR